MTPRAENGSSRARADAPPEKSHASIVVGGRALDWRLTVGVGLIALGIVLILVGWFGISGETEEWRQFPYLVSGGIGGAAAIAIGLALLSSLEHSRDREALAAILDRLDEIDDELHREVRPDRATTREGRRPMTTRGDSS